MKAGVLKYKKKKGKINQKRKKRPRKKGGWNYYKK